MAGTPDGDAVDRGAGWLDAAWEVLAAGALPRLPGRPRRGERRFVLLHPAHGLAILDTWSAWSASTPVSDQEMAAALDAELTLTDFLRRFDPRLPVRRIHMAQAELPRLAGVVARSYAGTPPLELPEAWMDAVRSTLGMPQPPTDRAEVAIPPRRIAGRLRLAAGIAALVAAGAVGLLQTVGDDLAQRGRTAPVVAEAGTPQVAAPPATLAVAVPEAAPLPGTASGDAESSPAMLPDPLPVLVAAPAERAADMPAAMVPQPAARSRRTARSTAPSRLTQGRMPNSSGSFIWRQSQQYATGNGG
jgi:hypothetical protein